MKDNFEKFIEDLKMESNNLEIKDYSHIIKANFKTKKAEKSFSFGKLKYVFSSFVVLLVVGLVIILNPNTSTPPDPSFSPTTTNDSYAFEIMSAANMIYSSNKSSLTLSNKLSFANTANTTDLESVANEINQYLLTMKEILTTDNIEYSEKVSTKEGYDYELTITTNVNPTLTLKYVIYYNKILVEVEHDESEYNLDGIMVIDNIEYKVYGETEIEDDETETKLTVYLNDNQKLVIEQELENDEVEYVYSTYQNSKLVSSYSLSFEDGSELELEFIEGKNRGSIEANIRNNVFYLEVNLDNYRGDVTVEFNENSTIKFYFKKEKKEILINFLNITNKTI